MDRTMRHGRHRRIAAGAAAAAALALGLLSGCATGQISQTANQVAAIDGANATVGDIGVRNARLQTLEGDENSIAAGGNATLFFWLTNDGLTADSLVSVSSSAAASVELGGEITVAPQSRVDLGEESDTQVVVTGLTTDLHYGQTIPLTFTFQQAGQLTTNVAIEVPVERSGERETVNILPPHPTPIWESGEEEHG